MTQQLRRAALSVHLNFAEGCSRKSIAERNRFYEIARGSVIEIDALPDIALHLDYFKPDDLNDVGKAIAGSFQVISKMIVNRTHN